MFIRKTVYYMCIQMIDYFNSFKDITLYVCVYNAII